MAKMKTFAVEVEITRRVTLFVQARRPNGAIDQVMSEDGWRDATAYHEDIDPRRPHTGKGAKRAGDAMKPEGTKVWRKNGRDARKGAPTGRRATHPVETAYGRRQRQDAFRIRMADLAREMA